MINLQSLVAESSTAQMSFGAMGTSIFKSILYNLLVPVSPYLFFPPLNRISCSS